MPYTELVNPVLTPLGDETEEGWEGCLSVPGLRGLVPRWTRAALRGLRPDRPPDPPRGRRLPRPRRPARMRPPGRHPLPDAHARPVAVRLHRRAVPGGRRARRVSARGRWPAAADGQTRSCSNSAVSRRSSACSSCRRAPSIRNTSSARSPSVLIARAGDVDVRLRQRVRDPRQQARPIAGDDLQDVVRALVVGKDLDLRRQREVLQDARDAAGRRRFERRSLLEQARQLEFDVLDRLAVAGLGIGGIVHREGVERVAVARGVDLGLEDRQARRGRRIRRCGRTGPSGRAGRRTPAARRRRASRRALTTGAVPSMR